MNWAFLEVLPQRYEMAQKIFAPTLTITLALPPKNRRMNVPRGLSIFQKQKFSRLPYKGP